MFIDKIHFIAPQAKEKHSAVIPSFRLTAEDILITFLNIHGAHIDNHSRKFSNRILTHVNPL